MWVWNYNQFDKIDRGMRKVVIEYTQDNTTWSKLGEFELPIAPGSKNLSHQIEIDFKGVDAKAVVIAAQAVDGNWGNDEGYYGLSEVRFGIEANSSTTVSGDVGKDTSGSRLNFYIMGFGILVLVMIACAFAVIHMRRRRNTKTEEK